ncbi:hypothetical protein KA005_52580 [bacterium]|nr:hypothetical protein [bacterium]
MRGKETELLDKWEKLRKYPEFVRDGIVDEEAYLSKRPLLVFLLKEANDYGKGDLRKLLVQRVKGGTWRNIARWAIGIKSLPDKHIPWEQLKTASEEALLKSLRTIAAVNLKKQSGGAKASRAAVLQAARKDKELISAQLEIYHPDIVVCCGVDDIVREISLVDSSWEHPKGFDRYFITESSAIWVEAYHPNAHENGYMMYESLINTLKVAMAKGGLTYSHQRV